MVFEGGTSDDGRGGKQRSMNKAGMAVDGIRNLMTNMESAFRVVRDMEGHRVDNLHSSKEAEEAVAVSRPSPLPLLERALTVKLNQILSTKELTATTTTTTTMPSSSKKRQRDFDVMFNEMVAFHEEHGHTDVPGRYEGHRHLGRKGRLIVE